MRFKSTGRGQAELFPPTLDDLVASDHVVRVIRELISRLNFDRFEAHYSSRGQHAYPPDIMTGILLYGMHRRVRASRLLADMCRDDIPLRWLVGALRPDFRTISDFRKRHAEDIIELLAQAAQLAKDLGVLKRSLWSTDGSVIKASARTSKNADRAAIEQERAAIKAYIARELARADATDDDDDESLGEDDDGSGVPPEMASPSARAAALDKAVAKLQQRARDPDKPPTRTQAKGVTASNLQQATRREAALDKALQTLDDQPSRTTAHPSDPDAVMIKRNAARGEVAYNAQVTVDTDSGLIIAAAATSAVTDRHQLLPQLAQAQQNTGLTPDAIVADRGYSGGATLAALEKIGVIGHLPQQRTPSQSADPDGFTRSDFAFDNEANTFVCPNGIALEPARTRLQRGVRLFEYRAPRDACASCPMASRCLKPGAKRRMLSVSEHAALTDAANERARSPAGRAAAKARRCCSEGAFASIKAHFGLRQFNLRGRVKATCELVIAALAHNAKKLADELMPKAPDGASSCSRSLEPA